MSEILQSPVALQANKSTESREALLRSLDDLLERYLNLLDLHQTLRHDLDSNLASV